MVRLVDDWKRAYRWFSTWLIGATGGLITAYETFPQLKEYVPDKWFHVIMGVMLFLIFVGRLIKQGSPTVSPPP